MRKWLRELALVGSLAFASAGGAAGQASRPMGTPPGWETRVDGTNLIWMRTSPAFATNILVVFDVADRSNQALRPWFEAQIRNLGQQGTISARTGITAEPGLLKDSMRIKTPDTTYRIFAFAYDTAQGKQIVLVMMSGTVRVDDQTVQAAFDQVAAVWRQRSALSANLRLIATQPEPVSRPARQLAPSAATAPSAPAASSKPAPRGCRDELRMITTMQLQQVCYAPVGGMSNCQLQSVPVQRQVLQTQC